FLFEGSGVRFTVGNVERPVEIVVERVGPRLGERAESVGSLFVGSERDRAHRGRLDHRDGDRLFHPFTGRVRRVVYHHDVAHAGFITGKTLKPGLSVVVGPRAKARHLTVGALSRAVAQRASSWSA